MTRITASLLAGAAAFALAGAAAAQTQGVTDDEVVIGSVNDLSGVFAAVGVPAVNGANMYFDMINEQGGVHGRQIRFIVEDHGYQLPRATQAYNKLLNRDEVFAMLLSLGTPHNLAGFRLMDPRGIFNINPLTAAREMLQEPVDNKFILFSSYFDQTIAGIEYLHDEYGLQNVCAMYLPTDFGEEIAAGTREAAERMGLTFAGETTHRPDEQDFAGAIQRLRSDGCEIVTQALGVRQGITAVGTARQLGWEDVKFLTTSAGFLAAVAEVPGGVTEGLYAAAGWVDLAARAQHPAPDAFIEAYTARYDQPATGFAMLGYTGARTVVEALEAAGPDLTQDSFRAGMHSLDYFDELMDMHISYGPDNHQGANDITISVVEDGQWRLIARQ